MRLTLFSTVVLALLACWLEEAGCTSSTSSQTTGTVTTGTGTTGGTTGTGGTTAAPTTSAGPTGTTQPPKYSELSLTRVLLERARTSVSGLSCVFFKSLFLNQPPPLDKKKKYGSKTVKKGKPVYGYGKPKVSCYEIFKYFFNLFPRQTRASPCLTRG